jgi:hypothetical protein
MKIVLALPENGRLVYTASNKQNHSIKLTKVIKGAAQIFESSRGTKSDDEISFIQNQ